MSGAVTTLVDDRPMTEPTCARPECPAPGHIFWTVEHPDGSFEDPPGQSPPPLYCHDHADDGRTEREEDER